MSNVSRCRSRIVAVLSLSIAITLSPATALAFDWGKLLEDFGIQGSKPGEAVTVAALSNQEVVDALKEALAQGAEDAIASLGRRDGFYRDSRVRIPMPQELATVESALRAIKQDHYADEFVLTMNRAAEVAVSESSQIVGDAVRGLTVADAKRILTGPDDAATRYFRRVGEARLQARLLPVVQQATERSGVTNAYKQLVDEAGFAARYLGMDTVDVDRYVTDRTLDGLFALIAVEEKRIRDDPLARSTELLEKVFGAQNP